MQASGSSSGGQQPIPRRKHTKSKTGCRTCKIRKVKCDERRPLCLNCERHFTNLIACDFDETEPILNPNAPSTARGGVASSSSRAAIQRGSPTQQVPSRRTTPVGRQAEPFGLPQPVGAGRIDPFEARPASQEPAPTVDSLMGHYLANFAYRSFPFYANQALIELWWPFVRNDEVLFNVVLLVTSLDRENLHRQHAAIHTRQLLDQCLTLLNARIQDPVASLNDHTLVAIALLASMEHDRGNMRALWTHLNGMKQMVAMRGGLNSIRDTNPMAANMMFWCSMIAVNEPMLLPITYGEAYREEDWLMRSETANLLTHDGGQADLGEYGVDVVTANILHEVQRLSRLYTSTLNYGKPQEAIVILSHLCAILEQLLRMSKAASADSPVPGLSQSCRLAGCLHVFTPLSAYFPNPTLMLHTLVRDLKSSLTFALQVPDMPKHLLLWLLSVGGITAHSMPERAWYVGHLMVVITDLEIQSWEVMRQNLIMLAFHDNFCDISFNALWKEAKQKQEALNLGPGEAMEWSFVGAGRA